MVADHRRARGPPTWRTVPGPQPRRAEPGCRRSRRPRGRPAANIATHSDASLPRNGQQRRPAAGPRQRPRATDRLPPHRRRPPRPRERVHAAVRAAVRLCRCTARPSSGVRSLGVRLAAPVTTTPPRTRASAMTNGSAPLTRYVRCPRRSVGDAARGPRPGRRPRPARPAPGPRNTDCHSAEVQLATGLDRSLTEGSEVVRHAAIAMRSRSRFVGSNGGLPPTDCPASAMLPVPTISVDVPYPDRNPSAGS